MKIQDVVLERWVKVGLHGTDCDVDQTQEHGASVFTVVKRANNKVVGKVAIQLAVAKPGRGALLTMIKVDDQEDFERATETLVRALADRADEGNVAIIADPRGFDPKTATVTTHALRHIGGFQPDTDGFLLRNPGSMRYSVGRRFPA